MLIASVDRHSQWQSALPRSFSFKTFNNWERILKRASDLLFVTYSLFGDGTNGLLEVRCTVRLTLQDTKPWK